MYAHDVSKRGRFTNIMWQKKGVGGLKIDKEELEWAQAHFDQLNLIKGKRLAAMSHGQLYQNRAKNAFDKRVRPRKFSEGDLILKKVS